MFADLSDFYSTLLIAMLFWCAGFLSGRKEKLVGIAGSVLAFYIIFREAFRFFG